MWVQFLGQEDPLEEGKATHSSVLAWRFPRIDEPGGLQSIGLQRVGHNWNVWACMHTTCGKESTCQCRRCKRQVFDPWHGKSPWKRKWQPTLVLLPGKFHAERAWQLQCMESQSDITDTHTGARAIHIRFRVTQLILKFEHQIFPRSMLTQEKTIFIVTQIPWYVLHVFKSHNRRVYKNMSTSWSRYKATKRGVGRTLITKVPKA